MTETKIRKYEFDVTEMKNTPEWRKNYDRDCLDIWSIKCNNGHYSNYTRYIDDANKQIATDWDRIKVCHQELYNPSLKIKLKNWVDFKTIVIQKQTNIDIKASYNNEWDDINIKLNQDVVTT
jgi:hypothetical protein